MAEPIPRDFAQLTDEAKKHFDAMGKEIEQVEADMDALEQLGLDTTQLREKVAWAKNAREVILKRLS